MLEINGGVVSTTTRVTVVVGMSVPLVPVMVRVELPASVVLLDVTLRMELPEPDTDGGLKLPVAPEGSPLTLNVTVPPKPPEGVRVTI